MFLVQWNAHCDNLDGDCFPDDLFGGRDLYEVVRYTLANLIPSLDDIARVGAMPTQTIRIEDRIDDLPDGGWNPAWCATPPQLSVPIGEFHGTLVERYFSVERWPPGSPNGQGTVLPNVPVVERALLEVGNEHTPRFVILIDSGRHGCPGSPDSSVHIDDTEYAEIRDVFTGPASRGVRTLVIGMRAFAAGGTVPFIVDERVLNAEAEGGGLGRTDGSMYPALFYDYLDTASIQAVVHEEIVEPFYCRLHVSTPVPSPDGVELVAAGGREATGRDRTRRDGWDFLDDAQTIVGLFGSACERAVTRAQSFSLVLAGYTC